MRFYYPNDDESKGMADLRLEKKQKTGNSDLSRTKFNGATFRFSNLDNYYSEGFLMILLNKDLPYPQASTTTGKQTEYLKWAVNRVTHYKSPKAKFGDVKAIIGNCYNIRFTDRIEILVYP